MTVKPPLTPARLVPASPDEAPSAAARAGNGLLRAPRPEGPQYPGSRVEPAAVLKPLGPDLVRGTGSASSRATAGAARAR